ncbi:hypothetical protein [Sphingobium sp. CCH11-B1]|jgi:hypothetical protein|nr:hypothetical protein [Sphingobium sp. CCH11-B1]
MAGVMASLRLIDKACRRCTAAKPDTPLTTEMPVNPPIFLVQPAQI